MSEEFTTRTSDEKCPECGKPILYRTIPGIPEIPVKCPCVADKEQQERKSRIEQGVCAIRAGMRKRSGMKKRQRGFFLGDITPRDGQREAYNAAREFVRSFAAQPDTTGIMFSGGVGSGKTLFAAAIANAVIDTYPISEYEAERAGNGVTDGNFTPVRFISTVELLEQLRAAYNAGNGAETAQSMADRLKRAPLLILDDMGAENLSEWAGERIFEIADHRYNEELPVIITTNATPAELKQRIGDRSFDRLREMCHFVTVTAKSQRPTAERAAG